MKYRQIDSQFFAQNRAGIARLLPPQFAGCCQSLMIFRLPTVMGRFCCDPIQTIFLFHLSAGSEQRKKPFFFFTRTRMTSHFSRNFFCAILRLSPKPGKAAKHDAGGCQENVRRGARGMAFRISPDFPSPDGRMRPSFTSTAMNTKRARVEVETREGAVRAGQTCRKYPQHDYQRLEAVDAPIARGQTETEAALLRQACAEITEAGFRRVCQFVQPGVNENGS